MSTTDIDIQGRLDAEVTRYAREIASDLRALANRIEQGASFRRVPGAENATFVTTSVARDLMNMMPNLSLANLVRASTAADLYAAEQATRSEG